MRQRYSGPRLPQRSESRPLPDASGGCSIEMDYLLSDGKNSKLGCRCHDTSSRVRTEDYFQRLEHIPKVEEAFRMPAQLFGFETS